MLRTIKEKIKAHTNLLISNKRYLSIVSLSLVIATVLTFKFSNVVLAAFASWGDASLIHVCKGPRGQITIVDSTESCGTGETPVTWLKDVDVGTGLSISRSSSGETISLASGAVGTSDFLGYQINPTDAQTTTSSTYEDMASGTQEIVLSQKSIVQVNAHANAYVDAVVASSLLEDENSNGNDLTNGNGVTEVSDDTPFSQASSVADFEGSSSQYLSISDGSQTGLDMSGDHTIEAWVNFESLPLSTNGDRFTVVAKDDSTDGYKYTFKETGVSSGSYEVITVVRDGTTTNVGSLSIPTPSTGTWYHVAITYDASAGDFELFWNGSSYSTDTSGSTTGDASNSSTFYIGDDGTSNYWDGKIDEVRVWNDIRSGTEINDNKATELSGSESNLVSYYKFGASGGNNAYLRTTYDSGGADTEIGQQGYTNVTTDGQSISAGGVVVLNSGTYTIALQKKVEVSGTTATYNQPSLSILVTPTE